MPNQISRSIPYIFYIRTTYDSGTIQDALDTEPSSHDVISNHREKTFFEKEKNIYMQFYPPRRESTFSWRSLMLSERMGYGVRQHHNGVVSAGAAPKLFYTVPLDLAVRKYAPLRQAPAAHQQRYPIHNAGGNSCQAERGGTVCHRAAPHTTATSRDHKRHYSSVPRAASPLLYFSPHRAPA